MTQTIEQLTARVRELERAESTLIKAGYTDCGGELWKPPLGESASHLLERISELEEENARLKVIEESALKVCGQLDEVVIALPYDYLDPPDGGDVSLGEQVKRMYSEVKTLRHAVVASQLHAEQLREALEKIGEVASPYRDGVKFNYIADISQEALAITTDTSALDAYVAEKVKEVQRNASGFAELYLERGERIHHLTRQRDLAVEAITRAIDMVGHPDNITYLQQTLDAIKESEAK